MERVTRVRQVIGVSVIGLSIEQPGLDLSQIRLMGKIGKSPALARPGLPGHRRATSGLPSASDIRPPKSAFALISSALPSAPDSQDGGAEGPNLTQTGSRFRPIGGLLIAKRRHWRYPKEVAHRSLTTLREKLLKIGARMVRHGRYITFQLAEVPFSRQVFRQILTGIARLRPSPMQT